MENHFTTEAVDEISRKIARAVDMLSLIRWGVESEEENYFAIYNALAAAHEYLKFQSDRLKTVCSLGFKEEFQP